MVIEELPPWPARPPGSHGKLSKAQTRARALLSHKYKKNRDERNARDEARKWLREAGLDFKLVCDAANIEPDYVSRKWSKMELTL